MFGLSADIGVDAPLFNAARYAALFSGGLAGLLAITHMLWIVLSVACCDPLSGEYE
jgi:hypothetical protein